MRSATLWLCLLLMLSIAPAARQNASSKAQSSSSSGQSDAASKRRAADTEQDGPTAPNSPAKILKYQHEETLKDLDKLVKLSTEVQDEVEKAGENVLPLATLKKLDDVEKLARKIRSRLKQ